MALPSHGSQPAVSGDGWAILGLARGLLALWVLFAHTQNFVTLERAMPVPSANAIVAVYAFLCISGFSIRHAIAVRPEGYFLRRFWRVAPVHATSVVLALLAYALAGPVLADGHGNQWVFPGLWGWLGAGLLLQAFLPFARLPVLFPSWSLSVEVIYYLFPPLLLRLPRQFVVAFFAASIAIFVTRNVLSTLYIGSETFGISVASLYWAWLAGWLLYDRSIRGPLVLALAFGGCLCIYVDPLLQGWFNNAVWLAVIVACYGIERISIGRACFRRFGNYVGAVSYPAYLLHYPIFYAYRNLVPSSYETLQGGTVYVAVALTGAVLCYHLIDRPLRSR